MPRSTAAHKFEFAILGWALEFRHGRGFVVALSSGGHPVQVLDGSAQASSGKAAERIMEAGMTGRYYVQCASVTQ